jgi:hypothetical protein
LKNAHLFRRLDSLCDKLADKTTGNLVHIDFDSFSEEEKRLFRKCDEIEAKFLQTGSMEPFAENFELICKNLEVILRRVRDMYCYVVPMVLGCDGSKDIVEYFFKLHFYNFEVDLSECLSHVRVWSEKEKGEFLSVMAKNEPAFFRIPRGFNDRNRKTEKTIKKLR